MNVSNSLKYPTKLAMIEEDTEMLVEVLGDVWRHMDIVFERILCCDQCFRTSNKVRYHIDSPWGNRCFLGMRQKAPKGIYFFGSLTLLVDADRRPPQKCTAGTADLTPTQ